MSTKAGDKLDWSQEFLPGFPKGYSKHLGHLFLFSQVRYQGTALGEEQMGLQPEPIVDASTTGLLAKIKWIPASQVEA